MRKRKYCDQESVFEHIWKHADRDGLWSGDDTTLAVTFNVSADAAYSVLSDLCDSHHLQKLDSAKYIIVRWRERDDAGDEEVTC